MLETPLETAALPEVPLSLLGEAAEPGSESGGGKAGCATSLYSMWTVSGSGLQWASQAEAGSPAYQAVNQLALGWLKQMRINLPP